MNLQVITPIAGTCVMNCPYCMANAHEHGNDFKDVYRENREMYIAKAKRVFHGMDLGTIIVTGTADPQQEPKTLADITQIFKELKKPSSAIELQTRIHKIPDEISSQYDVVAFSIDDPKQIPHIKPTKAKLDRFVFVLTDKFNGYNLQQLLDMAQFTPKQVTFKPLIASNEIACKQDEWVRNHHCDEASQMRLSYDVAMHNYQGNISMRWDATCWQADNRYIVFRQDGDLYHSWDDAEPAMIVRPMGMDRVKSRVDTLLNRPSNGVNGYGEVGSIVK